MPHPLFDAFRAENRPTVARRLLNLLYPPKCTGCGELLAEGDVFCPECQRKFSEQLQLCCPKCLKLYSECECADPFLQNHGIRRIYKMYPYQSEKQDHPANRLLYSLKQNNDYYAVRFAVFLYARLIEEHRIDTRDLFVTFIPASYRRLYESGADPMKRIAEKLAKRLGSSCISPLCRRNRRAPAQKQLTKEERVDNAFSTYDVRRNTDLHGKTILLLDDICTTGATLAASAAAMRRAGASRVICMVLAKTAGGSK